MRITVIALDTRGGVQPYAALSLGLVAAGHDVRVVAPSDFAPMLHGRGLTVAPLSGSVSEGVRAAAGAAEMTPWQRNRMMREKTAELTRPWAFEALAAAEGSDLVTGGIGGMLIGAALAEKLDVPFVEAHLQPLGPPTTAFPGVLLPHVPQWVGAPGLRLSHRLTMVAVLAPFGGAVRETRRALGLPKQPRPMDPAVPSVYGYSPLVVPHPPEWGPNRRVTGYWQLPAGADWVPPADLVAFLADGPAPVCIGFGSMSSRDPEGLAALVLQAVRRAGVRAVLLSGWGGLATAARDDVYVMAEAPHDWLYPQTAAVVHHGGAGTTGAALAAGVPSVIVPFGVDQPFWASRVATLGVGLPPIPRRRLTAKRLGDALRRTADDPAVASRAAHLGARIRAERGVENAVRAYELVGSAAV